MGSEDSWNKIDDGTSFQPSEPALCANGCGFFGAAATMNLCSKCYRDDLRVKEEQAASAKAAVEKLVEPNQKASGVVLRVPAVSESPQTSVLPAEPVASVDRTVSNRCCSCRKKVGVMGFKCRCGSVFCGSHRYPENHSCSFNFKAVGRDAIAKENPVIKADKVEKI